MEDQTSEILDDALLVETALEVANPIGGICTVIKTKAPSLLKHVKKDNFLMLGILTPTSAGYEVKSMDDAPLARTIAGNLEHNFGIKCIYAEWLVDPDRDLCPNILLFDASENSKVHEELARSKYFLGLSYGIKFPDFAPEVGYFKYYSVLLGTFVNLFVRELLGYLDKTTSRPEGHAHDNTDNNNSDSILTNEFIPKSVILQSHEWCGAIGQLLLHRDRNLITNGWRLKTVFTTHATILGRYLSADNQNIVALIANHTFGNDTALFEEANRRQIGLEFSCEWSAARTADTFTAVSDTTADEAAAFLQRRPEVITYNGSKKPNSEREKDKKIHEIIKSQQEKKDIDDENPKMSELETQTETEIQKLKERINSEKEKKTRCREKLNTFIRRHFFGPSLETMDFNKMIYVMCCGRNEFSNKGIDMFIDGLAKLNTRLKSLQHAYAKRMDITVVGILISPSLLALPPIIPGGHFQYMKEMEEAALANPDGEHDMCKLGMNLVRNEYPPLSAGCIDGSTEIIIQKCLAANLTNHPLDPVKFLWIPKFMPFADVLPMSIDEIYDAIDCGVFPSKYEPWGYTPIECLEHGIPAVTTNLAGCGCFYEKIKNQKILERKIHGKSNMINPDSWRNSSDGLKVIDRLHSNYEEASTRIADSLFDFISLTDEELDDLSQRCTEASELCKWDALIERYISCYEKLALSAKGN